MIIRKSENCIKQTNKIDDKGQAHIILHVEKMQVPKMQFQQTTYPLKKKETNTHF